MCPPKYSFYFVYATKDKHELFYNDKNRVKSPIAFPDFEYIL